LVKKFEEGFFTAPALFVSPRGLKVALEPSAILWLIIGFFSFAFFSLTLIVFFFFFLVFGYAGDFPVLRLVFV